MQIAVLLYFLQHQQIIPRLLFIQLVLLDQLVLLVLLVRLVQQQELAQEIQVLYYPQQLAMDRTHHFI